MPDQPEHNPTHAPAPGSAAGPASAPGNSPGPGRSPAAANAPTAKNAPANNPAGNTHPARNQSAGHAKPPRDQTRSPRADKTNPGDTGNTAHSGSTGAASAGAGNSHAANARTQTGDAAADTRNSNSNNNKNNNNTDIAADALRFIDTADVLAQFTQIEGRFTQVEQGLAHLQRLATLGTITATLIHEFNNILTPITSYAQLALLKPDDAALARKTHEKTLDAAERATKLCAALLGYAREDDEHTPARAQLDEVVHASLACLGNGLASRGIVMVLDLTDAQAAISPAGLEQVLVNLILNARKAMLDAGGTLTIRTRCDQSSVRIEVADTGPGVPPHIADRLFEPFVTAPLQGGGSGIGCRVSGIGGEGDESGVGCGVSGVGEEKPAEGGSNSGGGTGLGLSVCRDLVRRAGGDIGFESRPGEGTTFHITLPKAEPIRRAG